MYDLRSEFIAVRFEKKVHPNVEQKEGSWLEIDNIVKDPTRERISLPSRSMAT